MYVITNARIVTPDAVLDNHELVVDADRIVQIRPARAHTTNEAGVIDADGGYLMPGFIDIHADYIEHMAAPRPTSVMDFRLSLHESERELITHGISTMFHSLAIYDFTEFMPSPIRSPENTRRLISLIDATHEASHLIRHRFHARFEVDNLKRVDELRGYIDEGKVHLISFMDHTPGQGQYRDLEMYRKTLQAYRKISDEEVVKVIEKSRSREKLTIDAVKELTAYARAHGIAVASHDDDSLEKLDLVEEIGTTISEFPITLDVAREARARGLHTVAGAPNILLGGSHSGNLSAEEAVCDGSVDVLCSDYYPPALLHAVFRLYRTSGVPMVDAVRLVTANPARAVLMDHEIGTLAEGMKADMIVVNELDDGFPVVTTALVDGTVVFTSRYRR